MGRDAGGRLLYRLAEISIHPPLAGRDIQGMDAQITMLISIHPPLAGRDLAVHVNLFDQLISIHPPLAGRDYAPTVRGTRNRYFNPPAPCGAGLPISSAQLTTMKFQSTRPLRGGTTAHLPAAYAGPISIHPPLAGRDQPFLIIYIRYLISIHPPLAGRDRRAGRRDRDVHISIHPPLAGRDHLFRGRCLTPAHFNPPAPCGAGLKNLC